MSEPLFQRDTDPAREKFRIAVTIYYAKTKQAIKWLIQDKYTIQEEFRHVSNQRAFVMLCAIPCPHLRVQLARILRDLMGFTFDETQLEKTPTTIDRWGIAGIVISPSLDAFQQNYYAQRHKVAKHRPIRPATLKALRQAQLTITEPLPAPQPYTWDTLRYLKEHETYQHDCHATLPAIAKAIDLTPWHVANAINRLYHEGHIRHIYRYNANKNYWRKCQPGTINTAIINDHATLAHFIFQLPYGDHDELE